MIKNIKETLLLRLFAFFKIPLIFMISPRVVEWSSERCVIRVPLNWMTRNHLHSMYFGSLCIGADCSGGLIAMREIQESGRKVHLSFKDFQARYYKRAEGDVHFVCTQGPEIRSFVQKVIESGERMEMPIHIKAYVYTMSVQEPVAEFTLGLSLKLKM